MTHCWDSDWQSGITTVMASFPRARRFLLRARIAVWVFALLAAAYLWLRFESIRLSEDGCSPVRALAPGDRLIYDKRPGRLTAGDVLIFRGPDDELLLGISRAVPASAPSDMHAEFEAGMLWIEGDATGCPSLDSRSMGPIDPDRVVGRLVYSLGG